MKMSRLFLLIGLALAPCFLGQTLASSFQPTDSFHLKAQPLEESSEDSRGEYLDIDLDDFKIEAAQKTLWNDLLFETLVIHSAKKGISLVERIDRPPKLRIS